VCFLQSFNLKLETVNKIMQAKLSAAETSGKHFYGIHGHFSRQTKNNLHLDNPVF